MRIFFLLFFPFLLLAQSFLVSSIPLPKTYVQNLDPYACDETCLNELIAHEQVFSFLAHAQDRIEDPELNDERLIYTTVFNLGAMRQDGSLKIALLLPYRRIGRYAFSTTNAVFAYMLTKNRAFEIKSFQIEDEDEEQLERALYDIQNEGFYYVIAPVTKKGASAIAELNPDMTIYFPTINKKDIDTNSTSLFFGGIDYRAQINALLGEAVSPLVIFYDKSRLGQELNAYAKEQFILPEEENNELSAFFPESNNGESNIEESDNKSFSYAVEKKTSNLEHQIKDNEKIQEGSFLLNTPIVKSGMVMSQLTLYDANVTNILSTQINYDPLIFSMTQYKDRKGMIIANSIGTNNNILTEANNLLSNDIVYDWINYTTTVGTDLFFHMITQSEREYDLPMVDNQIEYPITLVEPSFSRFIAYMPSEPDFTTEDDE